MIFELATYEKLAESRHRDGGNNPARWVRALAALPNPAPGVGWQAGRLCDFLSEFLQQLSGPGLFLEDLYVRDEFRGKGIGKR